MSKFRDTVLKILKEGFYDSEYDEYYPDEDEAIAHDDKTYTTIKLTLKGHDALLQALQEIGYTKENDYDPIYIENGEAYILIEDALVEYEVDVEYNEEYISEINSVSAPRVIIKDFNGEMRYMYDTDQQVEITDKLLPEDLKYIKNKLSGEVELKSPDYDAELRSDYYHSVL